jgi:hypothetical protein
MNPYAIDFSAPASTAIEPVRLQCRHLFTDGRRCGSPALRSPDGHSEENQPFCYFHHRSRRPVQPAERAARHRRAAAAAGPQTQFALPNPGDLSDRSGIQFAIGEVLRRIASNELDPRRAGLLLYGLQIASRNLPKSDPREERAEPVSEITLDPEHGLLAPPAEFEADKPKGSAWLLLQELGD